MSLRMRMMITKQFENLINELVEAQDELSSLEDDDLISIKSDIEIAKNRIIKFREKTIKGFEKKHKEKLKRLKEIRKSTN
ncbi:MAG: hypothetical protein NC408_02240 [Candidatus Gastranaerophilales bacterium]|nr:hypothetical protein [Candidatus Gastranaerophilales bacterium]MCM1073776.1 hypothetical protein [Bacteroides sp.]